MEKIKNRYIAWIFGILFVIATIFASVQYTRANAMKISVENNYNRAFSELVNYVDDIQVLLDKSMLVSTSAQTASISSELFRQTTAAKACLAQLPISEVQLENTEKFLSQIGDYTYSLSQKVIYGDEISEEDYQNLSKLGDYADNLNEELLSMQDDLYSGEMSFGTIKNEADTHLMPIANAEGGGVLEGFSNVEKKFQEYPSLIYDGPFSEHIEKMNPVMCEKAKKMTFDEVFKKAQKFLENENIIEDGESANTALESYLFKSEEEGRTLYAAFTKKGGYPLYFLINREFTEEKLTVENAIARAKSYIYDKGFSAMEESYYDKQNGVATINFAYKQGNVTCYSDLIKVKVALDDGEIVGFESNGYLMSHQQRTLPEIKISEEEAKSKVNKHLAIEKTKLALIPKDNKQEVLCYEIGGKYKEKNFLIYINVENGREEQILMLLESENGILTI